MSKSELTISYENALIRQSKIKRIFGCTEVTIGWYGRERVDYLTLDFKGKFRCYEIKVSKPDFYSKSKVTFVGHYNYYVMPRSLYEEVKADIPENVGVKVIDHPESRWGIEVVKKAKKQVVSEDMEKVLYNSMIRCLCRENDKLEKKLLEVGGF